VSQENGQPVKRKKKSPFAALLNWPLVRKLESLVFLAMFLAMPLFAFRVIDYTARQLALQNSAHDLVKDIRRAKEMSSQLNYDVTVEGRRAQGDYAIRHDYHVMESIVLPKGVFVLGEVTFKPSGLPKSAATFEVHTENRTLDVDVDAQGVVSMP